MTPAVRPKQSAGTRTVLDPMEIHHFTIGDYVRTLWKNGSGVTVELARAGSAEEYDWRLSIATVTTDGPFSLFPGYRRVTSVLDGAGMKLTVDGRSSGALRPFTAFAFDGDSRTECALLDGPVQAVNLIHRRDRVGCRLTWLHLSTPQRVVTSAPTVLVLGLESAGVVLKVHPSGAGTLGLGDRELVRIECAEGVEFTIDLDGGSAARAVLVEIWPL